MIGLIGKKVGMTRFFGQDGESIVATAIQIGSCHVVQVKDQERDGYRAVQLGAFSRRKKLVKKPQLGHFEKAGVEPKAKLVEFRVESADIYRPGQELRADIFQVGDRVKVTGTSKGKGFAGGIKRHGFHGGPKTHGQSDRHRAPGSLGGSSYPSRVWKGQRMAGRMGNDRVSIRNIEVVQVDTDNNLLLLRGAVPGARNSYVIVQRMTALEVLPGGEPETEPSEKERPEAEQIARGKPEAAEKKGGGKKAAPAAKEKSAEQEPAAKEKTAEAPPEAKEKETAEEKPDAEAEGSEETSAAQQKDVAEEKPAAETKAANAAETEMTDRSEPETEAETGDEPEAAKSSPETDPAEKKGEKE
jgi:large subunit ribosomal protein L3